MKNQEAIQFSIHEMGKNTPPGISLFSGNPNPFDGKTDLIVWKAFCEGNNQAFSFLYKKYVHLLFKYGCQLTTDRELVQDCIQSLFLELRTRENKPDSIVSIKSYLLRALYRNVMRAISKERKFGSLFPNSPVPDFQITVSPEKNIIGKELAESQVQFLQKAILLLTKKQREAITYYFYEGMSYEEIAYVMQMKKVHSARKLIYKALDGLKSELKRSDFETPLSVAMLLGMYFLHLDNFFENFS